VVLAGWLVDRIGIRWMLLIGGVAGGAFVTGMFFITTFTQGLVFMALTGMGLGCLVPSTTKAILMWFSVKERAMAMGLKQTGVNVGGIIAASTLPALALVLSWRHGFVGIGFMGIVIGIIAFILYREPPQTDSLNAAGLATSSELTPSVVEIFKGREIWLLASAAMCLMAVEFSAIAYLVLYLKESLLFPVVTAGFFLAVAEASGAFGKPLAGLVSDRLFHGHRKGVYISMCCIAGAMCLILAFLQQGSPSWVIVPLCFILGFTAIGWGGLQLTLVGEIAGEKLAGTVTGMTVVIIMVGALIGPPIFGYTVDVTGSYQMGWQLLAALAILAAVLLLFIREEKRRM